MHTIKYLVTGWYIMSIYYPRMWSNNRHITRSVAAVSDHGIHHSRTKNNCFVHRCHIFVSLTDFLKFYKYVIFFFVSLDLFKKKDDLKKQSWGEGVGVGGENTNTKRNETDHLKMVTGYRRNVRRFMTKVEWWVSGEQNIFILPLSFSLSHSRIRTWNLGQCSLGKKWKTWIRLS